MSLVITERQPDSFEDRIAAAACHSDSFLERYQRVHSQTVFEHFAVGEVVTWCVEYFEKYNTAPKGVLRELHRSREHLIPEELKLPIKAVVDASVSWRDAENIEYLLTRIKNEFKLREAQAIRDKIDEAITLGDADKLDKPLEDYKQLDTEQDIGFDPFQAEEKVFQAFDKGDEILFRLPGALGRKLNRFLKRKSFVAITAPEKRGKSYFLFSLAKAAYKARNNVLLIQAGDLSDDEGVQRIHMDVSGKNIDDDYTGIVYEPVADCFKNQIGSCALQDRACKSCIFKNEEEYDEVIQNSYSKRDIYRMAKAGYIPCTHCRYEAPDCWQPAVFYREVDVGDYPLSFATAWRRSSIIRQFTKGCHFQLVTRSNSSFAISDIPKLIRAIEKAEGWVPDVVAFDYMEIAADEPGMQRADPRDKDDAKCKAAKKHAQDYNYCFLSAFQGKGASHKNVSLDTDDISENKRRLAHVNFMGSLNQTPDEKRRGIIRVGSIVQRAGNLDVADEVMILQCLERGRMIVDNFDVKMREKDRAKLASKQQGAKK